MLHLPMMKVIFPSNCLTAYSLIIKFVAFDILDNNEIYAQIVQPYDMEGHEV